MSIHSSYTFTCVVFTFQKSTADFSKEAKDRQRAVRQCEYPACGVNAKDKTLYKCPGCRVSLYCSKDHASMHMSEHESFCDELTRACDYPACERRALVSCRTCKVAMYCGERHRSKHCAAHESVCEELRCARKGMDR